jgi:hypothetical protein
MSVIENFKQSIEKEALAQINAFNDCVMEKSIDVNDEIVIIKIGK